MNIKSKKSEPNYIKKMKDYNIKCKTKKITSKKRSIT